MSTDARDVVRINLAFLHLIGHAALPVLIERGGGYCNGSIPVMNGGSSA